MRPHPGNEQTGQARTQEGDLLGWHRALQRSRGKIAWALRSQSCRRHQWKRPSRNSVIPQPSHPSAWEPPEGSGHACRPPVSTRTKHCRSPTQNPLPGTMQQEKGLEGTILPSRLLNRQEEWLAHCLDSQIRATELLASLGGRHLAGSGGGLGGYPMFLAYYPSR
jgi:hypothetical protein